jgi:hypothetical protein
MKGPGLPRGPLILLSKLRCELSKIYLPQVGSSDELPYFLTYLYLFINKCAKIFGFPDA